MAEMTDSERALLRRGTVTVVALFSFPRVLAPEWDFAAGARMAFDAAEAFVSEAESRGLDPMSIAAAFSAPEIGGAKISGRIF